MSNWKNELEICWNKLKCNFSKIILILILKGKRAVPVQLYIFIIFMCLQRWIWINLKLMNSCQTERMNLKYVEINWNVIFSKIILILSKRQKCSTRTTLYFYHFYVSTKVNMNKFETNEFMSNWKNELEICWNKLKYVEINWNVIFSKIILILILKHKTAVPVPLYIFIMSKGDKSGTTFPWCNTAKQTALCNGW